MKGIITTLLTITLMSANVEAAKIIFTSNAPELYPDENGYSLAKISSYVKRMKQGDEPVLFIHGGDSLYPNPLSVYDKGAHMISIMNSMSVDALGVNRREFNDGFDQISLLSTQALFPMVLSNLLDRRTLSHVEGVRPYALLPLGDMTLAVLMTVSSEVNTTFLFNQAIVDETSEQLLRWAEQARQQGADKVLLITENSYLKSVPLSRLQSLDIIMVTQDGADKVHSERPLVMFSGGVDDELAVIDIQSNEMTGHIVHVANEPPDDQLQAVIKRYTSQLDVVLNQELVTLAAPMDSHRNVLRSEESRWGNIVLDAIRHYTRADFAATVGGGIRGYRDYEAGYVLTRRDVQRELPFGGNVYVVEVNADKIKQLLEHSVSRVEDLDGRFLQVSGLHYEYDGSKPVGQRIMSIKNAQGQPLEKGRYTLAISDYMLEGGDGYNFSDVTVISDNLSSQRLVWNIVSDYLEQFDTISPAIEGRIINRTPSSDIGR